MNFTLENSVNQQIELPSKHHVTLYLKREDKIHPTIPENEDQITSGALAPSVIQTDFGNIGCQICFDANWAENWLALKHAGAEIIFFFFPNFLEPLFLIYATIQHFKKERVADIYLRHRVAIWVFVVVYKLQDEWVTHVGNIDRPELIKSLFT